MATFLEERIAAIKAQIIAYEAMFLAFTTTGVEEYRLDTGQTRTHVRRSNLEESQKTYERLLVLLNTLENRNGGAVTIAQPAF
jgi:hypothetical protein